MPRDSKKAWGRMNCQRKADEKLGDVRLNDFANSSVPSGGGRLKKPTTCTVVREVKQITSDTLYNKETEELEDYDENESKAYAESRKSRRKKKSNEGTTTPDEDDEDRRYYPLDLWYLLSYYIRPEDIACFAAICQSALYVVNTSEFWFCLYKRYYKDVPNLPQRLQPECMERHMSLRPCVIRALYFMYPPFVERLKTYQADPHELIKRRCVLMWHQKVNKHWHFYFKLQQHETLIYSDEKSDPHESLMNMLEDVNANSEEGCRVLEISCLNFVPIPIALGLTLTSVNFNVSAGMRYHRLRLVFCLPHRCNTNHSQLHDGAVIVTIDPVVNLRVLDWWHPQYPYNPLPSHDSSDF